MKTSKADAQSVMLKKAIVFSEVYSEIYLRMKNFIDSVGSLIRSMFSAELAFRLYVVLQLLGIATVIYMDASSSWDIFPTYTPADVNLAYEKSLGLYDGPGASWHINWDFFYGSYWGGGGKNWFAVLGLFGPFLVIKSIDWILAAKNKE